MSNPFDQYIKDRIQKETPPFHEDHWKDAKALAEGLSLDGFTKSVKETLENNKPSYKEDHFDQVEDKIDDAIFDGKLSEVIQKSAIPFDESHWNQVKDQLPKKKRKRRFILWILFALGLFALLSILYLKGVFSDSKTKKPLVELNNYSKNDLQQRKGIDETKGIASVAKPMQEVDRKEEMNTSSDKTEGNINQVVSDTRNSNEKRSERILATNTSQQENSTSHSSLRSSLDEGKEPHFSPVEATKEIFSANQVGMQKDSKIDDPLPEKNKLNSAPVSIQERGMASANPIAFLDLNRFDLSEVNLSAVSNIKHIVPTENKKSFSKLSPFNIYLAGNTTWNRKDRGIFGGEVGVTYIQPLNNSNRLYATTMFGVAASTGDFQHISTHHFSYSSVNAQNISQELTPEMIVELVGGLGLSYRLNKKWLVSGLVRPRYFLSAYGEYKSEKTVSSFALEGDERISRSDNNYQTSENTWLQKDHVETMSIGASLRTSFIVNRNWQLGMNIEYVPNYLAYKSDKYVNGLASTKSLIQGGIHVSYTL